MILISVFLFIVFIFIFAMYIFKSFKYYVYTNNDFITIYEIYRGVYIFSVFIDTYKKEIKLLIYNSMNKKDYLKNLTYILFKNINFNDVRFLRYRYSNELYYDAVLSYQNNFPYKKIKLPNNIIVLNKNSNSRRYENILCLTTFINYNKVEEFEEFINHYIKLGIDLFIIYKTSCNFKMNEKLNEYKIRGKIIIIEVNYNNKKESFKYGNYLHVWKHNDCFNRYKYYSKHILFVDQDELLITKGLKLSTLYDIYYYYSLLKVTNNITKYYSKCPSFVWKYFIYNTECVVNVDIHKVNIKRKCKIKEMNFNNNYIFHSRSTFPWYYKKCIFFNNKKLIYH